MKSHTVLLNESEPRQEIENEVKFSYVKIDSDTKASKSSSPISFGKETLSIHELGYELGASTAEQWPSLMHFKKYKGMSYLKYRKIAAKNCLRVLSQPAFNDEFKGGFMIGFEKNTGIAVYMRNADGHLDFAGWDAGQLSSEPPAQ